MGAFVIESHLCLLIIFSLIDFLLSVFKNCPAGIVIIRLNRLYDLFIVVKGCIAAILPDGYDLRQRFRNSYFI